jgi:DNA-binding MarR family transcriptional regulator/GNAT superfamily N-acetyltransferase
MAVKEIREFDRFYTNFIGALDYGKQLHTPFTLTEARVLYELAQARRTDAADLRMELSLDAGYLSRILARFEERELVTRRPSEEDARRQRIELTGRGREAASLLAERAEEAVGVIVGRIAPQDRSRLTEAMRTVQEILGEGRRSPAADRVTLRGPRPGDLGWAVECNAAVYAEEFGFNEEYEALVAKIVADFAGSWDPRCEAMWVAELDGRRAGCVFCVRDEAPETARLRLLIVDPSARGHGIGGLLVGECISFARSAGYRDMVLWTNDILTHARSIYLRAGFTLVKEQPHHSFGRDLVGQDWHLALR